ncbi:MAG TPA: DUF3365 domain-containing protein [Nitrospira sp.]|nr:DUF3365 domain-containing protein [Nitrospira sp.]
MTKKTACAALVLTCWVMLDNWTIRAAEPSFELTARYILEVVKAFRTAYVLKVVEHAREGGIQPNEEWQKDSHFIPLPAQFVKAAGDQLDHFEIGLIGLTPVNRANFPKTQAETDALLQLMKNRDRSVTSFVDGDQFKAISADLALVQSCVDCHNHHPKATRRDFQRWDVMGGLVVRLKRDVSPEGSMLGPAPSTRPSGPIEKMTPPVTAPPPWVR